MNRNRSIYSFLANLIFTHLSLRLCVRFVILSDHSCLEATVKLKEGDSRCRLKKPVGSREVYSFWFYYKPYKITVVGRARIELTTNGLKVRCST